MLADEKDYTRALSLSRLAYDLESLVSPVLAAALLTVMNFHWLFSGMAVGFAISAGLVIATTLPRTSARPPTGGIYHRTTRGMRLYLKTPRLRGLLAVTLAAAAASAMVIVNTVVLVRAGLGLGQREVAITLAAFGGGSMLAALALPRVLDRMPDRKVMLAAASMLTIVLAGLALSWPLNDWRNYWYGLLAGWAVLGVAYSASITPGGRLLRRSSNADDRPALFAAQFALSHVCWLAAYPLAGQIGARLGYGAAFAAAAGLALLGLVLALMLWPSEDPEVVQHHHEDLPADHPHLREHHPEGPAAHAFMLDDLHRSWPR